MVYTIFNFHVQVPRCRGFMDSLSMDGAEVAMHCMCSNRSCPTCTCPDKELADPHRGNCTYSTAAAVMAVLDEARDEFLDDDDHVKRGHCKDVTDAERRIKHKLIPRNVLMLIPFFELFTSCPKDELHQWY